MQPNRIHPSVAAEALSCIESTTSPVLLFGSFARGDAVESSDIDALEIAGDGISQKTIGRVNVYRYAPDVLRAMAVRGSLFVLHLRTEGVPLRDSRAVNAALADYAQPATYDVAIQSLVGAGKLLDVDAPTYTRAWRAYNDAAVFVARTLLFIQQAVAGRPLFSIQKIAERTGRPDYSAIQHLKNGRQPDWSTFAQVRRFAEDVADTSFENGFGSTEALLASQGDQNPALMSFGLRVLGLSDPRLGYELLSLTPFG